MIKVPMTSMIAKNMMNNLEVVSFQSQRSAHEKCQNILTEMENENMLKKSLLNEHLVKKHATHVSSNEHLVQIHLEKKLDLEMNPRTAAFNIFEDKQKMAECLKKTKPCRNILIFGKCNREVCHFAHTDEELEDRKCIFDQTCRNKSVCKFKHSDETREEYRRRCNIKSFSPKRKVHFVTTTTYSTPSPFSPPSTRSPSPSPRRKPVKEENLSEDPETVICVPAELATLALQTALKEGRVNVRIEIDNSV